MIGEQQSGNTIDGLAPCGTLRVIVHRHVISTNAAIEFTAF